MNMKLLIFPIIVIGLAGWLVMNDSSQTSVDQVPEVEEVVEASQTNEEVKSIEVQSQSFGAVDVEVTPKQVKEGDPIIFYLSINTHSVDLDYDFVSISSLEDEQGNVYQAQEWTGGQGGHHLRGELVFDNLKSDSKQLMLTINGIDGETNEFEWGL